MRGDLTEEVTKDGVTFTRRLDGDRTYSGPDGAPVTLPGRALMLVRNVGHLTSTAAILDSEGREAQEGLLDAMLTVLGAKHDLLKTDGLRSSRTGSVYVVKPKMHGPDEVAFTDEVFTHVEALLGLAGQHGEARHHGRGAADHTQPQGVHPRCLGTRGVHQHGLPRPHRRRDPHLDGGGPMVRKAEMRAQDWISAYEDWNVDVGLSCGLPGRAQNRQGDVGSPRPDGADARGENRTPEGRRELRLGTLADRPRPCTRRTTSAPMCSRVRPN